MTPPRPPYWRLEGKGATRFRSPPDRQPESPRPSFDRWEGRGAGCKSIDARMLNILTKLGICKVFGSIPSRWGLNPEGPSRNPLEPLGLSVRGRTIVRQDHL